MLPRDIIILVICCLAWGTNFVVSAWALGNYPVPPFLLAATRAAIVLVLMGWFLTRPRPAQFLRLLMVCACVGPIHLGFLYTALQTSSASASSIVSQMMIPLATILSMIFLREKVGWVRGIAIIISFIGVIFMVYEPEALRVEIGLIYMLCAYVSLAVGSVLMRTVGAIDWRIYVAWMALMVFAVSVPLTLMFETGHADIWANAKGPLLIAAGYAAICVTIIAHGQYFKLLSTYEVSQVVPLTLLTTVFACFLGVIFLSETLYIRYIIGALLILPCVYIIATRQNIPIAVED